MAGVVFTSSDHHITICDMDLSKQDRYAPEPRTQQIAQMRGNMSQRKVLVHYHIFKNAGTTFERVLDENYGESIVVKEEPVLIKEENKTPKTSNNNDLPVEEPISDDEDQIEE